MRHVYKICELLVLSVGAIGAFFFFIILPALWFLIWPVIGLLWSFGWL